MRSGFTPMLLVLALVPWLTVSACKPTVEKKDAAEDAGGKSGASAAGDKQVADPNPVKKKQAPVVPAAGEDASGDEALADAKKPVAAVPDSADDVLLDGTALFNEHCSTCHGDFENLATPAGQRFGVMLGKDAAAIKAATLTVQPMKNLATLLTAEQIDAIAASLSGSADTSVPPVVIPAQPSGSGLDINNLVNTVGGIVGTIFGGRGGGTAPGVPPEADCT